MALKVELKPGERIIVGDSIITNDNQRTRLFIEGQAPILREKDILTPATADLAGKADLPCCAAYVPFKRYREDRGQLLQLGE